VWQAARFAVRFAERREVRAIAALLILLGAFTALLILIRNEWLPGVDLHTTRFLQRGRGPVWDKLAEGLTAFGGFVPTSIIGGAITLWLLLTRRPRTALILLGTFLLGHPLNLAIKLIAQRPRPTSEQVDVLVAAHGTSFPSGHAMATMMAWGMVAVLAATLIRSRPPRYAIIVACALLTFLIGASRVYVGGHWTSDVLGGWVCGLFFLVLIVECHRLWARSELAPNRKEPVSPV
jgi:undecaprenyl-diphosphatase